MLIDSPVIPRVAISSDSGATNVIYNLVVVADTSAATMMVMIVVMVVHMVSVCVMVTVDLIQGAHRVRSASSLAGNVREPGGR